MVWVGVRGRSAVHVSFSELLYREKGLTKEKELHPEEQVERNVLRFRLCEEKKGEHVKKYEC